MSRPVTRHTSGAFHNYPLYYFVPSHTSDGRYLVYHSEQGGFVQLWRLDTATGETAQLTHGRTQDAGWAIWCEWHLRGIRTHLSAINPLTSDALYFEDDAIRAVNVATRDDRLLAMMPAGQLSIGQAAVSPDGLLFAFIHADKALFEEKLRERETLTAMGQFHWNAHHQAFRDAIPTTLALLDLATGEIRTVIETSYHFHHALFVGNDRILVNHPQGGPGMWVVDLDGSNVAHLRPSSAPGAHDAVVNHQVVTEGGIVYEAVNYRRDGRTTWFGRLDPATGAFSEGALPLPGYVHAGFDPAGRFDFVEHAGPPHQILSVHPGEPLEVRELVRLNSPDHDHQRHHAHPFLSPDRQRMFFTDWDEAGFAQICSIPVGDLTGP